MWLRRRCKEKFPIVQQQKQGAKQNICSCRLLSGLMYIGELFVLYVLLCCVRGTALSLQYCMPLKSITWDMGTFRHTQYTLVSDKHNRAGLSADRAWKTAATKWSVSEHEQRHFFCWQSDNQQLSIILGCGMISVWHCHNNLTQQKWAKTRCKSGPTCLVQ